MFEGYKYKYRLNAKHYLNGNLQKIHPHTFEILLYIEQLNSKTLVPFSDVDVIINDFLKMYQDKSLNDISPFDVLEPTIENLGNVFYEDLRFILSNKSFYLMQMEISETPLRLYLISDTLIYTSVCLL